MKSCEECLSELSKIMKEYVEAIKVENNITELEAGEAMIHCSDSISHMVVYGNR